MKSGRFPIKECLGAITLHSVPAAKNKIPKGKTLSAGDIALLEKEGHKTLLVTFLEDGDLPEEEAAREAGKIFENEGVDADPPERGRVNLRAARDGLFVFNEELLIRLNTLNEGLGIALLPPFTPVREGQLLGTIKIIPFALPKTALEKARKSHEGERMCHVTPFRFNRAVLVQTRNGTPEKVLKKSAHSIRTRMVHLGGDLEKEETLPHHEDDVATFLKNFSPADDSIILMLGASATSDRNDVLPAALKSAGGRLLRLGIPVDPGNLLFTGEFKGVPVIGLPGCARSLKLNGFDWILERMAAGLGLTEEDFARLGQGGLLKDIPERPCPRFEDKKTPRGREKIVGLVLASGMSRRFEGENKLLADFRGTPVVAGTVEAVRKGGIEDVYVVVGHDRKNVKAAMKNTDVHFIDNPEFEDGMGTSIAAGIKTLENRCDGVLIALGDMPGIKPDTIKKLRTAMDKEKGKWVAVPTWKGKRGNPVLWHRKMFSLLRTLKGDKGGKIIIEENPDAVLEVPVKDPGILLDLDTKAALDAARKGA